jgi:hypothetical protein
MTRQKSANIHTALFIQQLSSVISTITILFTVFTCIFLTNKAASLLAAHYRHCRSSCGLPTFLPMLLFAFPAIAVHLLSIEYDAGVP